MSQLATITAIPRDQLLDFKQECDEAQAQVLRWISRYELYTNAPHGTKKDILASLSERTGIAQATIVNKFSRYRILGWTALINRSKYQDPKEANLPKAFTEWVKTLFERFQRNNAGKQVYRYIIDRNRKWRATLDPEHALPGFISPLPDGPEGHPANMSYKSIMRLRPPNINLVIRRQGKKAAASLTPNNYTTRVGLKFGQRIFFDDQEYDTKVNALGYNDRSMRPKGFNALEQLSAAFVDYTAKMTLWDLETEKKRDLKLKDFTWFSIRNLLEFGYRDDEVGTTHIYEHGTTTGFNNKQLATPDGFHSYDEALKYITKGRVHVERSGRFNDPMFSGMLFRPQSTGNFRFKAPLESIFNLVRNYMAALPGPTGQHYTMAPEEMHGMDAYNKQLLKVIDQLPDHRKELLIYPYMNYTQFGSILVEIYQLINARRDHHLEGWEKLEFFESMFRLDKSLPWQHREDLLKLDHERRDAVGALAEWKDFRLSPQDIMNAHKNELTKLDPALVIMLLPRQWAFPVKVNKNHEIHITDPEVGKDPFIYLPRFKTRYGHETLEAGKECLAYWHPVCSSRVWLCNTDGSYIGTCPQFIKPTAGDTPSILSNQGRINAVTADITRDTRRRTSGVAQERQQMKKHNDRVIAGEPTDPAERRAAGAKKAATTRHSNKVKKRAQQTDATEALDAWSSPNKSHPEETETQSTEEEFNPFSE